MMIISAILLNCSFAKENNVTPKEIDITVPEKECNPLNVQLLQNQLMQCTAEINQLSLNSVNKAQYNNVMLKYEESNNYVLNLKNEVEQLNAQLVQYKELLTKRDEEISQLKKNNELVVNEYSQKIYALEVQLNEWSVKEGAWKKSVENLENENKQLNLSYNSLQADFVNVNASLQLSLTDLEAWKKKCSKITFIEEETKKEEPEKETTIGSALNLGDEWVWRG
jgi:DNA repair exonuclease SbcCD ATPase subunit